MEIRTLGAHEMASVHALLGGHGEALARVDPAFFRRQIEADPGFQEHNVWLALDRGQPVACAQIAPRRLRILGHGIPTGALSTVFTHPEYRGRGIATALVESAATAMRERGMELSVTFADNRRLFERLGWHVWKGERSILRRSDQKRPARARAAETASIELVPFDRQRDRALSAVKAIHTAYAGSRNGTAIRDDALWESTLALAGNPSEEFWVARRGGLAVAYVRAALLDEGLTVTELGRFEDGGVALAKLIAKLLEPRLDDPFATAAMSSSEIRSFLVLPTFDDIGLTVSLEHEGVSSHPLDNSSGLVRCLNVSALAARLDVELLPGEEAAAFLERILPPDGFVFWPSDRF